MIFPIFEFFFVNKLNDNRQGDASGGIEGELCINSITRLKQRERERERERERGRGRSVASR